ncbi:MAG TPA: hypothetical protein VM598_03940 [Bdellovibrionota bacterium]|nr:hypothetical protein [Bdellovibrionota bacterium]
MDRPTPSSYRVNPIESFVCLVAVAIFCHSVFELTTSYGNLRAAPAGGTTHTIARAADTDRSPASTRVSSFRSIEFDCEDAEPRSPSPIMPSAGTTTSAVAALRPQITLSAAKIRISGPLCGAPTSSAQLIRTQVINGANRHEATVFTDLTEQKFSTDYIPLVSGKNPIHVEFMYQDGKVFTRDIAFERN